MYFNYYHRPIQMMHASAESVMARLRENEQGNLLFDNEGQRRVVKEAITAAHHLFLHVLALQNEYFELGFDEELEQLGKDCRDCWAPNEPDPEIASEIGKV
jgi:hypothetical protein